MTVTVPLVKVAVILGIVLLLLLIVHYGRRR